MRFHDLQHTCALLILAAGFSAFEMSPFIGHDSVVTTTSVYGHLIPLDCSEQITRFERYVGGDR